MNTVSREARGGHPVDRHKSIEEQRREILRLGYEPLAAIRILREAGPDYAVRAVRWLIDGVTDVLQNMVDRDPQVVTSEVLPKIRITFTHLLRDFRRGNDGVHERPMGTWEMSEILKVLGVAPPELSRGETKMGWPFFAILAGARVAAEEGLPKQVRKQIVSQISFPGPGGGV